MSDERLVVVCCIAYFVDAVCFCLESSLVFQPVTVAEYLNFTNVGSLPGDLVARGIRNGMMQFIGLGIIGAWIGVMMLSMARHRLIEKGKQGAFSTSFLKMYAIVLPLQIALIVLMYVRYTAAETPIQRVRMNAILMATSGFSGVLGSAAAYSIFWFAATGLTIRGALRQCNGPFSLYASMFFFAIYVGSATAGFIATLLSTDAADDAAFDLVVFLNNSQISRLAMFISWFFNARLIELNCYHLINVKKAEEVRRGRKAVSYQVRAVN